MRAGPIVSGPQAGNYSRNSFFCESEGGRAVNPPVARPTEAGVLVRRPVSAGHGGGRHWVTAALHRVAGGSVGRGDMMNRVAFLSILLVLGRFIIFPPVKKPAHTAGFSRSDDLSVHLTNLRRFHIGSYSCSSCSRVYSRWVYCCAGTRALRRVCACCACCARFARWAAVRAWKSWGVRHRSRRHRLRIATA